VSWRLPKFPLKNTRVNDADDVNANFYEVVEELGGHLSEHNWNQTTSIVNTDIASDAAFVWHSVAVVQAMFSNLTAATDFTPDGGNWARIETTPGWELIDSMTRTFTSPGCLLDIQASWQMRPNIQTAPDDSARCSFGIRLDGVVIPESILGIVDMENYRPAGIAYGPCPLECGINIPVGSGSHTVELVVRTTGDNKETPWVGSRELGVLEMRSGRSLLS
jgi:hypothetical protein